MIEKKDFRLFFQKKFFFRRTLRTRSLYIGEYTMIVGPVRFTFSQRTTVNGHREKLSTPKTGWHPDGFELNFVE